MGLPDTASLIGIDFSPHVCLLEPLMGLEPTACSLRMNCSTN